MQKQLHPNASIQRHSSQQILIRRREVERLTALSRSRIYDLLKRDEFPKPVRLGAMSVAWIQEEVLEWIASRIANRDKSNPSVTA